MDLEDAGFSSAAPISFCRFLHPSIHPCTRPSIPPLCSTMKLNPFLNTRTTSVTLIDRITKSFLFSKSLSRDMAGYRTLFLTNWPFSPFKNSAGHLKSWRMLISSGRPGSGCADQSEIQKKPRWLVWCLISLHELDSELCIQKLSFVWSQKYYRAAFLQIVEYYLSIIKMY